LSARIRKSAGEREQPASRPFHYYNRTLRCDGIALDALADEHGTPLYMYSAEQIRHRFGLFQQAFAGRPATVCFAVKANSALAILRLLAELGAGFDIVSGGELERVRRANKAALKRVVFSGVGKQVWEIDAALLAGILLFSGSLYVLALSGLKALGAVTPLGGLAFLAAWFLLAFCLLRSNPVQ